MAAISESQAFAKEQVTPFFSRAQLVAFAQPPAPAALKTVNRGGSHDYLPHEYIRELLNRLIGSGLWEVKAVVHSTDKEIIKKGGKDQIAATAIVNVELSIFCRHDPSLRITYSAIGSHTMYAGVEQGFGSVIGNAIDSAESDGIKAAAKNLGRAFGFDLKNKLDRNALPPTLADYERMVAGKHAERQLALAAPSDAAPAVDQDENSTAQHEMRVEPVVTEEPAKPADKVAPTTKAQSEPVAEASPSRAAEAKAGPAKKQAAAPAEQLAEPAAAAEPAPQAEAPAVRQWELSMDPGLDFNDWVSCITTMKDRVEAMTSAREIESFVKRYAKRIKDLPILEGRDFKDRWRKIVARKYYNLGLEIPAIYAPPAEASA